MGDTAFPPQYSHAALALAEDLSVPAELRQKIQSTLSDLDAPSFVRAVLRALLDLSSVEAVSLFQIQDHLDRRYRTIVSPRLVKRAIKELIETYGIAIGAGRGTATHGYYFILSDKQAQEAVVPLLGEIRSLAKRVRCLSPNTPYIQHLLGQMEVL
jgi:hypothetical protein